MLRAGFASAEEFRRLTYIAALMRCFVANCAHWLDAELEILKPRVLILVGQMAIARFLGPGTLESRVGRRFGKMPVMIPLPHPSGQSRWLNDHANRARLEKALAKLAMLRTEALV